MGVAMGCQGNFHPADGASILPCSSCCSVRLLDGNTVCVCVCVCDTDDDNISNPVSTSLCTCVCVCVCVCVILILRGRLLHTCDLDCPELIQYLVIT